MKLKIKSLIGLIVLTVAPFVMGPGTARAQIGGQPFSGNQFPTWFAVQTTQSQAISNANEIVLYQTAVPRFIVGNNGFMRVTTFEGSPDAAAATVTHRITCYLGGTNAGVGAVWGAVGLTPGTPVFTNTFTTTAGQPVIQYLMPNNNALTNFFYGTTTTNSYAAGDYRRQVTYGTQTNGILLTITGAAGGTGGSTNIVNLDALIVEALGQ